MSLLLTILSRVLLTRVVVSVYHTPLSLKSGLPKLKGTLACVIGIPT